MSVFYLARFWDSLMLLYVLMVCSFLLLSNIPLTNIPQFAYPATQLINHWIVSSLGLLWTKLLWTFEYTFFFFLMRKLGVGLLCCMVKWMFDFLRKCQPVFQNGCTILHSSWPCLSIPGTLHSYWDFSFCLWF